MGCYQPGREGWRMSARKRLSPMRLSAMVSRNIHKSTPSTCVATLGIDVGFGANTSADWLLVLIQSWLPQQTEGLANGSTALNIGEGLSTVANNAHHMFDWILRQCIFYN